MGLPARCYDSLSVVYTQPKESFIRRYGTRIAGGIACAAVVSFIMHLWYVKMLILWACQLVLLIFGRPPGYDKIPAIKKKAEHAIVKGKEIIHDHRPAIHKVIPPVVTAPTAAPKVPAAVVEAVPIVASAVAPKIKAENAAGNKIATKITEIEKKVEKREEKLANSVHDVADAARKTGLRIQDAIRDRKEAKDQEKFDKLIVRARDVGVTVDAGWSLTRLEAEVESVEEIKWHKRFNAQCPYCHRPTRIRKDFNHQQLICPGCRRIYTAWVARGLGAPPRVRPHTGFGFF
jgi:hypothetical protein